MLPSFRRKRPRSRSAKSDINVAPLIDVLLVLLVIFMVITPLTPRGLRTTVPQEPPPGQDLSKPEKVLVLSMDHNGDMRLNQEEVQLADLSSRLQDIFKTRRDHTVFVQGDNSLLFNDIAHIIDLAKGAGADRVGFMTNVGFDK